MEDNDKMPAGKKSLRRTVRGSLIGYISGKPWINFGNWDDPWAQSLGQKWLENT